MKLPVIDLSGAAKGELEFAEELLIRDGKGTQAVHDTVVAYQANQRLGTAKAKQMGEVAGSGKKPWRQKGTGRARAGSFQSPLWRGGAVVFGPRPRDFSIKVPKKVKSLAFRKVLSERLIAGDVVVIDDLKLASHKTKELVSALRNLAPPPASALIVTVTVEHNLKLASRNVPHLQVEPARGVNVYELLRFDKIVATKGALQQMLDRCVTVRGEKS